MRLKTYRNTSKHRITTTQNVIYDWVLSEVDKHFSELDTNVSYDEKLKKLSQVSVTFSRNQLNIQVLMYSYFINLILGDIDKSKHKYIQNSDEYIFPIMIWEYDMIKTIEKLEKLYKSVNKSYFKDWEKYHDKEDRLKHFYEFLMEKKHILHLDSLSHLGFKISKDYNLSIDEFKSLVSDDKSKDYIKKVRKDINKKIRLIKRSFKFGGTRYYEIFKTSKLPFIIKETSDKNGILFVRYSDYEQGYKDEIDLFFTKGLYFVNESYKDIFKKVCVELDNFNSSLELKKFFGWYKKVLLVDHYRQQNKTSEGVFRLILKEQLNSNPRELYKWVKYKQLITKKELLDYYDTWDFESERHKYYTIIMNQDYIRYDFSQGQLDDEYWSYIRDNFSRIMDEFKGERENTSHIYDLNTNDLIKLGQ